MTDQNNNSNSDMLMLDPADGQHYIEELQNRLADLLRPHQTIEDVEKGLKKLLKPDSELIKPVIEYAHKPKSKNNKTRNHTHGASFTGTLHMITSLTYRVSNLVREGVGGGGAKIDEVSKFKMAIIEFIISDILHLAGDFVRRHKGHFVITRSDIRTAMHADKDLLDLFLHDDKTSLIMEDHIPSNCNNQELSTMTYKEKVRYIVDAENSLIRGLNLIIKVFKVQLEQLPQLKKEVDIIFCNIEELLELSTLLLTALEDALESAGHDGIPYVGSEILDLAHGEEFFWAYYNFAYCRLSREKGWHKTYQSIISQESIMTSIRTAGQSFDLAVKYLLPKYLKNTIFQFFEYYKNFSDLYELSKKHDGEESEDRRDQLALKATKSILFRTKKAIEFLLEAEVEFEPKEVESLDPKQADTIRSILEKRLDAEMRHERNKPLPYMPPPEIYKFSEPDSKDNIQLETTSSIEVDARTEIRCATLIKLVERLTYHKYQPNIVDTFLATYRSFLSDPEELLDLLIERFKIPEPPLSVVFPNFTGTQEDLPEVDRSTYRQYLKRFRQEYSKPVKMRVINVLKIWIKSHYHDFERNPALLEKLLSFLDEVNRTDKILESLINAIKKTIEQKKISQRDEFKFMLSTKPPPIVWFTATSDDYEKFDILTLHPVEFARQLTLFEFDLFRAIKPSEFINDCDLSLRARKVHKSESSPNLSRMTRHFTLLSYWIRKCIVEVEDLNKRAAIYNRAIEIMGVLKGLNNFTGLLSIGSALQSAPISRLSHTKNIHTKEYATNKKIMDDYLELNHDHQKKLEQELKKCNPPCIPYLGSYQTKLIHAKEGNKTFMDEVDKTSPTLSNENSPLTSASPTPLPRASHFFCYPNQFPNQKMINFHKQRIRAKLLAEIANYQNPPYCLEVQPDIRRYIESIELKLADFVKSLAISTNNNIMKETSVPDMTKQLDDYLFEQSERIEPKNSTKPPTSKSKQRGCWKSPGIKISATAK